jgi:hypothetical protein
MEQTSGAEQNHLIKGMNKDLEPSLLETGWYIHAINATDSSKNGNYSFIQNKLSNNLCVSLPYTYIGHIKLPDQTFAIFSTNNTSSEIGVFNSITCTYTKVINSDCLNFNTNHLIKGVSKESYLCETLIYWTDGFNPRRFMNIKNPPMLITGYTGGSCPEPIYSTTILDCDRILVDKHYTYPCITSELEFSGDLHNGRYQFAVAYSINENIVSDWLAVTKGLDVYSHQNYGKAIRVEITNLDTVEFSEYKLACIYTINNITSVDILGTFNINQKSVYVSVVGKNAINNKPIPLSDIVNTKEYYNTAQDVATNGKYLLWSNLKGIPQLDYQRQALSIRSSYILYKVPPDYYQKGGDKVGFMRDEVYAFGIKWLYNTGEWSPVYHIPGRASSSPDNTLLSTISGVGDDLYESYISTEICDTPIVPTKKWEIYNTGSTPFSSNSGGYNCEYIVGEGEMAYWESSELYPSNSDLYDATGIGGPDVQCTPIRHHKFPDCEKAHFHTDENSNTYPATSEDNDSGIYILGIKFFDIDVPRDDNGNPIPGIVGYKIVRGNRIGNRSILAKGLLFNTLNYMIPKTTDGYTGTDSASYPSTPNFSATWENVIFPNYPYNPIIFPNGDSTTIEDPYINGIKPALSGGDQATDTQLLGNIDHWYGNGYSNLVNYNRFTFHSPTTSFYHPSLGGELYLEKEEYGNAIGKFIKPDNHPKYKLFRNDVYDLAAGLAVAAAVIDLIGEIPDATVLGTGGGGSGASENSVGALLPNYESVLKAFDFLFTYQNLALEYKSHCFYSSSNDVSLGNKRRFLTNYQYLLPTDQSVNTSGNVQMKFNNWERESSLYLETLRNFGSTNVTDTSKFIASQTPNAGDITRNIDTFIQSTASSFYASIKNLRKDLYGQLDSIHYLDLGECLLNGSTATPLFGGDTYINRFTVKRKMQFFKQNALNQLTDYVFDYNSYGNVGYPRYFVNNSGWTPTDIFSGSSISSIISNIVSGNCFANINYELDGSTPNSFQQKDAYFYLSNSGIADFYCESEINVDLREYDENLSYGKHYSRTVSTDYYKLLHNSVIPFDNLYLYDSTYSKQLVETYNYTQDRNFDKNLNLNCFYNFKDRVVYSERQDKEDIADHWLVYPKDNFYDFPKENGELTSLLNIGNERFLFFFQNSAPYITELRSTISTKSGGEIAVTNGHLFDREPYKLLETNYNYACNISKFANLNTIFGTLFISNSQGRVFLLDKSIEEISKYGMEKWFKKYLPFKILEQFPAFTNLDNTITGVGMRSVYNNSDEKFYITKIDYKANSNIKYNATTNKFYYTSDEEEGVHYVDLGDSRYFTNVSWTLSYCPKEKYWKSFHTFIPEFYIEQPLDFISGVNLGDAPTTLWKHDNICNSFCNYYGTQGEFSIEIPYSTKFDNKTLRNVEYHMDAIKYFNSCNDTAYLLNYNFDSAIIYNKEQISGQLNLNLKDNNDLSQGFSFPQINTNDIDILYAKSENKFRFNQFWDITNDRGEYSSTFTNPFILSDNGWTKIINSAAVDYNKSEYERKKFRGDTFNIILSKANSHDTKMIFNLGIIKDLKSER